MTPRDKIKTRVDFERFLRSRGFTRREAQIIAVSWKFVTSHSTMKPDSRRGVDGLTHRDLK